MAAISRTTGGNTISTAVPPTNARIPGHVAGEALEAGDVVYIKASDGRLWKATAAGANEAARAVGLAGEQASAGQAVTLLRNISVGYSTGLTPGAPVFLSPSVAGNLDDATSANAPRPIGFVLGDGKRIHFHFNV